MESFCLGCGDSRKCGAAIKTIRRSTSLKELPDLHQLKMSKKKKKRNEEPWFFFFHLRKIKHPDKRPCNERCYYLRGWTFPFNRDTFIIHHHIRRPQNWRGLSSKKKNNNKQTNTKVFQRIRSGRFISSVSAEGVKKMMNLLLLLFCAETHWELRCHQLRPFYLYVFYPWLPVPFARRPRGEGSSRSL